MARSPKGSIVHSIPSFHPRRMMAAGGAINSLNADPVFGLYNNATDGSSLVVWHLEFNAIPHATGFLNGVEFGYAQGIPPVTQVPMVVQPLFNSAGQLAGRPWMVGTTPYDPSLTELPQLYCPNNGGPYIWPHEWPIAIVNSGWSFYLINNVDPNNDFAATMIWEVVKYI